MNVHGPLHDLADVNEDSLFKIYSTGFEIHFVWNLLVAGKTMAVLCMEILCCFLHFPSSCNLCWNLQSMDYGIL